MVIWVIVVIWIFLYSSSVYSCHLFLISSVRSYCFRPLMCSSLYECSLDISNFLEEISSLSLSFVFLYFFAMITEEGFLMYPCYSVELYIQMAYLPFSPFPFTSLLFSTICMASSDNHFAFLHFFFLGMVLIPVSCTMSIVLQALYQI